MFSKNYLRTLVTFALIISTSMVWGATSTGPIVSVSTSAVISSSTLTGSHVWRTQPNSAFGPGEVLQFSLKWGVVKGGNSTLSVQEMTQINGRAAYHIVSEARSVGVVDVVYKTRDRNQTWLDAESLLTVRYEKHIREGRYRVDTEVELDHVQRRYRENFQRLDKGTTSYIEGDLPKEAMDVLGSLYYIRTQPLEVGQSYTIDVYDNKKIWPLVVNVIKKEKVRVPAGKFDCFLVEPILREPGIFVRKGKKLQVWMTTDATHMPVLMRTEVAIGHVAAELTKYHRPPIPAPPAAESAPTPNPS